MFNENLKRGTKVNYTQKDLEHLQDGEYYRPITNTYVWAIMAHLRISYVIQHPQGRDKECFLAGKGFEDGFESIHSSQLKDGHKYIYANESELEIIKQ